MMIPSRFLAYLALVSSFILCGSLASAFTIAPKTDVAYLVSSTTTQLHGWADAFKNDASLGKAENPGIKGGPKFNEQVTVNDKPVPGAVAGQKLTVVANKVRVKIPVNCQAGDCGTCMVTLNGRKVKACQTPLPAGKAVIKTL